MSSQQSYSPNFLQQVDKIQAFIESIVDAGNEQELFISAYVNGHFDLAVVACQGKEQVTLKALDEQMQASLIKAKEELDGQDFEQAMQFWQRCTQQASAS